MGALISIPMVVSIIPVCTAEKGSDWRLFSPEVTAGGYFYFVSMFRGIEWRSLSSRRPGDSVAQSHLLRPDEPSKESQLPTHFRKTSKTLP
jgi:hypothetical protein